MVIRPACEADIPAMLEIYAPYVKNTSYTFECSVPDHEAFISRFRAHIALCPWLVAENGTQLLGYAYAGPAFERQAYAWAAEISVYLRPEAHRKGIGQAFYRLIENSLMIQGYRVIYAVIVSDNEASVRFHEALGYQKTALFPACGYKLGGWHSVLWMEKRLNQHCPPQRLPQPWRPEYCTRSRVLISACLLGAHCRYDGGTNGPLAALDQLSSRCELIPACAEQLGGLPTPRVPSERRGQAVINREGLDVTEYFHTGAGQVSRLARLSGCRFALLKARSPSCGSGEIYDGSFTRTLTAGDGVTAARLKQQGIPVFTEEQLPALLQALEADNEIWGK